MGENEDFFLDAARLNQRGVLIGSLTFVRKRLLEIDRYVGL